MCKILVIAPYAGLKDLFIEINRELNKDLTIFQGDLKDALEILDQINEADYDVVISRGATAKLLRNHCSLPVIDIKISGYDILRSLTLVKGYAGKVGIMSYMNVIQGADSIGKLLDMNLQFYPINEEQEIGSGIHSAVADGINVIIGDVISTTIATRFGLHGILIISGKESVLEALYDAEHLVYYLKQRNKSFLRYKALLVQLGVHGVIVDESGNVMAMTPSFKQLFKIAGNTEKLPVSLIDFETFLKQKENESTQDLHFEGEIFKMSKYLLTSDQEVIGAAALVTEDNSKRNDSVTSMIDKQIPTIHFNHIVHRSALMNQVVGQARQMIHSELPILINGEKGAGKKSLAQAIHNEGKRRNVPFLLIKAEHLKKTKEEVHFHDESHLAAYLTEKTQGGTIFIENIDRLPLEYQITLSHVMERLKGVVGWMASSTQELSMLVKKGLFSDPLLKMFQDYLEIPSLRNRIDDLNDLTRWFMASINSKMGKQIVGIKEDVLKVLKKYAWPGNVRELKKITEQMCLISEGPFIQYEELQSVLDQLVTDRSPSISSLIDYHNKTLLEIEQEVVEKLLAEENYNQSRVAQLLGINRTTLWRKLKENK